MWFYSGRILSNYQLNQISNHKYNCINASYLDPLLQPFWTWLVNKLPLWLAPNLITISGLFVNIATTLLLVWYSPDARAEAPRWAYAQSAFGLFLYQTLDAIDGKQARRTNTSSPLGELFDHGCDSVSTVFLGLSACIAVRLGLYPRWMFVQCFAGIVLFYCSHWNTYVSGTMRFGRFDATEAQFCIIAIQLISTAFGPDIWLTDIKTPFGSYPLSLFMCCVFFVSYSVIFIKFVRRILKPGISADVFRGDTLIKKRSISSPGFPILFVVGSAYIILRNSPTQVYHNHPALFVIAFGMVAAKITNKLVVMHMTKDRMMILDSSFCGPIVLLTNQYFNSSLYDYFLVWLCLVWAAADLLFYSLQVYREICGHLSIRLLHISSVSRYRDAFIPLPFQLVGRRIADSFREKFIP